MAGILKVDKYQDFNGNDIMTSDGSGNITINNAALKNTPAFSVKLSANQSISDDVLTRVAFDTENFDTDNAFDTSTYLFTVPTGKAGKYSFTYLAFADDIDANDSVISYLEKNGTIIGHSINQFTSSLSTQNIPIQNTTVEDCAEGDEIEVVVKITGAGTQVLRSANTIFTGYRLIGV